MELIHRLEMRRNVDGLIRHGALAGVTVILFGHCNATEETADYLIGEGVTVSAILDNSEAKQGMAYRGVPITSVSFINKHAATDSIVLISTRFYEQMKAQLHGLGYDGEIVKLVDYNTFAEYSLSDEAIHRKQTRMLRGLKTLETIRAQFPTQHLVVCPNNALGDVYWAMAFLPAYREKHGITDTAVVTIGSGCRQTVTMFETNAISLKAAEMDELVQAIIYTREQNCIIAHHDRPYTDNIIRWLDTHFLSFVDYYRRAVYGLPPDADPAAPTNVKPCKDVKRIERGNTVIIAPYAKSVVQPKADFWERLAEGYKKDGYRVCTNVNGVERAISGTIPLNIPPARLISAVEYAGHFVGLRSGLCDIVHTANCRKTVVFPDCFYSTTPHKVAGFFDLPGWEKIVAIDYK